MAAESEHNPKLKSAAKPGQKPSRLKKILTTLWRPFPLFSTAVAISTLMFWPEILRVVPDLQEQPEYQLSWSNLTATSPGRWVPPDLVSQVQQKCGLPDPLPVLDDRLVENLADAFSRHPWVAEVISVTKTGPQTINIEMKYRTPVLMVRTKRGGLYPVDRDGILLPPNHFSPADAERFPILTQVHSLPIGPAGTAWGDEAVLGAARLAEALTTEQERSSAWETFGMDTIAVLGPAQPAKTLDDVTLGLTTNAGSQVIWGRPPGGDTLEPTVEQKLHRLDQFLPKYGDANWSTRTLRLDIRRWDVVDKVELTRDGPQGRRFH